jgi:hypothetical protein
MPTGQHGQGGSPPAPQGAGGGVGPFSSPGLLAAGAAGCAAAFCALWAFNGLPLGSFLLWLTPLPLFLAGLGFGTGSAAGAALLATLLVAAFGSRIGVLFLLALFALPVPLLVGLALRGGGAPTLGLSSPLMLIGVWPVAVLLLAAFWMAGEGGLEATMRRVVEGVLMRLGVAANEAVVSMVVRVNAAAFGLLGTAALVLNGIAAQRFLARRGLARAATPDLRRLRLPGWYPLLPLLAAIAVLAAPAGHDAVAVSALLLLLLPPFFLGIAGVHLRAGGRPGRVPMLGLFYVLLVVFLQFMAPAMVALGLFDHFRRGKAAPT